MNDCREEFEFVTEAVLEVTKNAQSAVHAGYKYVWMAESPRVFTYRDPDFLSPSVGNIWSITRQGQTLVFCFFF